MHCSKDEGISLLRKWQAEVTELSCALLESGSSLAKVPWVVRGKCWVHGVADDGDKLVVAFSDEATLTVLLRSVSKFEFGTPLDLKSASAESVGHGSWLTVFLPGNLFLILGEREVES